MNKFCKSESISAHSVTDEELKLINAQSRRKLTADEVYTFNIVLCDNNVDRDNEMFSVNALNKLAKGFVGIGGGFNHSMDANFQHARIYMCEVRTDETKKNTFGDAYTYLFAKAYIPKTADNLSLIEEIDTGIKKEVSISCSGRAVCSVCGKDINACECEHIKGKTYGGKICCGIIDNISDCYEWSFVCVPAQPNAMVTKSFDFKERKMDELFKQLKNCSESITLSPAEVQAVSVKMAELERLADDGIAYRKGLKRDIVKLCAFTFEDINSKSVDSICEKLDTAELEELKKSLCKKADSSPTPQFSLPPAASTSENKQFKI